MVVLFSRFLWLGFYAKSNLKCLVGGYVGGGLHILWFKVMLKELRVANTYKSNSRRPYTLIVQVSVHIRVSNTIYR